MVTKKIALGIIITFLILTGTIHGFLQFAVYGTGVAGFYESGISGFSIGEFSGDKIKKEHPSFSSASQIILLLEWFSLLAVIIISLVRGKTEAKKELETIKLKEKYNKGEHKTDLDILYDILKERKHLNLNTISKIFKVDKEVAKNWCETLESGNLATLRYPRIGDPELVLND